MIYQIRTYAQRNEIKQNAEAKFQERMRLLRSRPYYTNWEAAKEKLLQELVLEFQQKNSRWVLKTKKIEERLFELMHEYLEKEEYLTSKELAALLISTGKIEELSHLTEEIDWEKRIPNWTRNIAIRYAKQLVKNEQAVISTLTDSIGHPYAIYLKKEKL